MFSLFYHFVLWSSKFDQCISNHLLGTVRIMGRDLISKARCTGRDVKLSVDRELDERGVLPKPIIKCKFTMVRYFIMAIQVLSLSACNFKHLCMHTFPILVY